MHRLFCLIKPIYIQEVVYKVQYMLATAKNLFQLEVAFLLLTCIHGQICITDNVVERTSYIM